MNATDLRKSATHYLRALQQAGLTDLPARSSRELGELTFESESPATGSVAGQQSTGTSPAASTSIDSADANSVSEKPAGYQAKSHSISKGTPSPAAPTNQANSALFSIEDAYGPSKSEADRATSLLQLSQQVAACTACPQLAACRKNTVFGVGNPKPRLAFYGEAPGADEDRLGEPFVGRAGELLNKILGACHFQRKDVYIFNTVKCRPPNNRNPHDAEIENCWNYTEQQLEILQPEFIVCLGSVAARTLLKTKESVGRLRGKFHRYRGSQVVVTYHPAYLLRTPAAKAKTWQDMQMLMAKMGVELD